MGRWFGTDGIRGRAMVEPMTPEMALAVGRAVAVQAERAQGRPPVVVVARDTRLSGPVLEAALVAGLLAQGARVLRAGVLPTPGLAHLVQELGADRAVMISASHNPFTDNGIKVLEGRGRKLSEAEEEAIERFLEAPPSEPPPPEALGRLEELRDAEERYRRFLAAAGGKGLSGLKLVLDCAHGAAYRVGPQVFRDLGAEVWVLHDEPDGTNINRAAGSEHPERLAQAVVERRAHLGLALDGDGDRLIAIDEEGRKVTGDQILAAFALAWQADGRLRTPVVVSTVMSNLGLTRCLEAHGLRHERSPVGDRYVRERMEATGAQLGGEDSGHLIFADFHTTGDGLLSGILLARLVREKGRPLSELAAVMPVYPQVLLNVPVARKPPLEAVPELGAAIRAAEEALGAEGRVLVRYSGTEPLCRVMVEGPTEVLIRELAGRIAAAVQRALGA